MRINPERLGMRESVAYKANELSKSLLERSDIFLGNNIVVLSELDVAVVHPQKVPSSAIHLG
jgi:hypothetical protein